MSIINIAAVGDCFINRNIPKGKEFYDLSNLIKKADVGFANFETTLCDINNRGIPAALSGGTWSQAHFNVLNDVKALGLNILSIANNHIMDYSSEGLHLTRKYLSEFSLMYAGAGNNLREAAAPTYYDTEAGRVSLIAATSTFHNFNRAGEQTPDICGRPGINPLRLDTVHQITKQEMSSLKKISLTTELNSNLAYAQQKGSFISDDPKEIFFFGDYDFQLGKEHRSINTLYQPDLDRIIKSIEEAKSQSDIVMVSLHSHEMLLNDPNTPPDFLQKFARLCIDKGANIFLGHGPHHVRGLEIYNGLPIFYGLGNFIFHNLSVDKLPWEMYEVLNLKHTDRVTDALNFLDGNGSKGYKKHSEYWSSILPWCQFENGKLKKLKIYPCTLGESDSRYALGTPSLSKDTKGLSQFINLSERLGSKFSKKATYLELI
jgi:poly-gamma-glutamate synthesis protein (capsule biosynthesis protein)